MNLLTGKRVAVIGGGPGGLTLARLLQRRGVRVRVYERDASQTSRQQGATLDLHHDSGLKALEAAGLMEEFRANYRIGADHMKMVDRDANVFLDDLGSGEAGPERPEIDRGPLRDLLIESLEPDTLVWNHPFVSLQPAGAETLLAFADGETVTADLVVAADGANSRVRPYITPIKPIYSGITVVEGAVHDAALAAPQMRRFVGEGKVCALGDEKSLFVGGKGDGSLAFYTGHKPQEDWAQSSGIDFSSRASVLDWFRRDFSGWSSFWNVLFEKAEPRFVVRPQYFLPPDQTWNALPNLTMLGDAAHVMPPYAGEGVNMAMLDALELAETLLSGDYPDARSAIASFETAMRKRSAETARMTLKFTEAFHSPRGLAQVLEQFQQHLLPN